jgi:hypothetical protein
MISDNGKFETCVNPFEIAKALNNNICESG